MIKKDYMKPSLEVIEADIEQQILAGSYTDIKTTSDDDDDDDNPIYDGSSSGSIWDAN